MSSVQLKKTLRGFFFSSICNLTSKFQNFFIAGVLERTSYLILYFFRTKVTDQGVSIYEINGEKIIHKIAYFMFSKIWIVVAFVNCVKRLDSETQRKLVLWKEDLPLIGYEDLRTHRTIRLLGKNFDPVRQTGGLMWINENKPIGLFQRIGDHTESQDGSHLISKFVWLSGKHEGHIFTMPQPLPRTFDEIGRVGSPAMPDYYYRPYAWIVILFEMTALGIVIKGLFDNREEAIKYGKSVWSLIEPLLW